MGRIKTKVERLRPGKKGSSCIRSASIVLLCSVIIGCQSIKEAGVVSAAAGLGAGAATAISGGVLAPIAGAMTGAFVADATTEVLTSPAQTIIEAEDNLFSILEKLVEIAGWALVLVFIGPMIIGWILPGPLERKKKS